MLANLMEYRSTQSLQSVSVLVLLLCSVGVVYSENLFIFLGVATGCALRIRVARFLKTTIERVTKVHKWESSFHS